MRKAIFVAIVVMAAVFSSGTGLADTTIRVAFGDALPPWVIPETNEGITIDLIRQCVEPDGYQIKPVYVPYARRILSYQKGGVDAVCDINPNIMKDSELQGYLSEIAYAYENIGVSLKKTGFKFEKIGDMAGKSILSWQGAKASIGGEYAEMAANNPKYREVADQKKQIKLLYIGRVDVIQLDRQIFKFYRNIVARESDIDTSQPVDIFPLFGKNQCGFLFRDEKMKRVFDKNFKALTEQGNYDAIIDKYSKQ